MRLSASSARNIDPIDVAGGLIANHVTLVRIGQVRLVRPERIAHGRGNATGRGLVEIFLHLLEGTRFSRLRGAGWSRSIAELGPGGEHSCGGLGGERCVYHRS